MWLRSAGVDSAGFPGRQRVEASDGGKMKWAGAGWAGGKRTYRLGDAQEIKNPED